MQTRDVKRVDYEDSYMMFFTPGLTCFLQTTTTAYLEWDDSKYTQIAVSRAIYRPPEDQADEMTAEQANTICVREEFDIPYKNGEVIYTDLSDWPYTDGDICSNVLIITNGDDLQAKDAKVFLYQAI